MNRCTIPTKLTPCIFALLCLASIAQASSPPAEDNVHFCQVLDYEDMRARDSLYAARKQALNLNVGEPRTVRMIYFLPNDRPFRQEVVDSMKTTIRQIQTFFRDQMRANGYGDMTFRFETDAGGNPMVHRVDGQYSDSHYLDDTVGTVRDEVEQAFDLSANVYLIVFDNSIDGIGFSDGTQAGGFAYSGGRNSGHAYVPGGFSFFIAAHELGHTFDLGHDWRDRRYIMSYGGADKERARLSACVAEFLAVHPYFNPDIPDEETPPPTLERISSLSYPPGSTSVPVQLKVHDPDGLHQVWLGVGGGLKMCQGLNGEQDAIVQFDYDGVIPSVEDPYGSGTSLSNPPVHNLYIYAVDTGGNGSWMDGDFSLWNTENERNVIATLEGHSSDVRSVSFSPDGSILASASYDSTVKLWDVATRQNIATLEGHSLRVFSVSFSPDGSTLASASYDSTVKLWDVATRQNIATLEGHRDVVYSVSFSPDGSILASGSEDATVKLWDVATRQNIATLEGHTSSVSSVSFSPDGSILASGAEDGTVKLWDVATRQNIATLEGHTRWVYSVQFSPDGSILASGAWRDNTIKLWDVATRQNIATLEGHTGWVYSVQFSPDGSILASGSFDNTVKLWDMATRRNIETLYSRGAITSLAFSPDGNILASGSGKTSNDNAQVVLWDMQAILQSQPQALVKISGDNQQGVSGEALTNPFVVEVRNKNGVGLAGFPVRFTVTAGDGKLSGRFSVENATTDANGRAQSTLTLGDLPGTNTVEASFAGRKVAFNAVGVGTSTPPIGSDYQTWHLPEGAIARLGKGRINEVAFSPDGSLLAVASSFGIWLYDAATSRELALLLGHTSDVYSVSFSPDGSTLASGSRDNTVKLWDVATRRNIATLEGHTSAVISVSFSPDGNTLASGSSDNTVKLWDVATRRNIATLEGHSGSVNSVSFSPDGSTLASGSWDNTVKLWDVATRRNIATLEAHRGSVSSVSFSPDGSTLASGSSHNTTVKLWDVATRRNIATLEGHTRWVYSVSFSPDGNTLASGSYDNTVKLWDVATRQNTATLTGHTSAVYSVSFSPDGSTLATGSNDNTVKLWDVATKSWYFFTHTGVAGKVSFSPDGSTLASGSWDNTVKLWDVATRRNIATLEGHRGSVRSVSFSPDGSTLASGSNDRTVKLWDVATRRNIATLEGHTSWVYSVSFSPDGNTLASGSSDNTVKLWDVATRRNIATLTGHTSVVNSVSFSPDGSTLASGSHDNTVKLWDVATRRNIATLTGHTNDVYSVSFSPDGSTLASGSHDNTVKLWDVATRRNIATLTGHRYSVYSVSFSPDGSTLASGAYREVKLWDVATRRNIATLRGHRGWVRSVSFSPDGSTLASGSNDGTVLLWDMSPYITPLTSFSLSLDGDGAAGDQAVTTLEVSPGPVATIQVFGKGIRQATGISARFEYDSAQVAYEGFDAGGLLPNAQVLAVPSTNPTAVEINLVSFGGQATADRGMVGTLRFRKMSAFSGTTLRLVRAELGRGTQRERVTFADTHITLQPAAAALTPDFNGDGRVDSADFVLFTAQYGLRQGDPGYDAWYDLDGDGTIGFGDFLIFGRAFGREGS